MIVGLGLDLVELTRIERLLEKHPSRFPDRICRPGEVQERVGAARVQHVGGLFAAKEAVMKALGTGWDRGVTFRQIEVVRRSTGGPGIRLHGEAARQAARLGVRSVHLTISHERGYAAAMVVLEGAAES